MNLETKKNFDPNGALLIVPSLEIAKEEGRMYVMIPTSYFFFYEKRFEIVVWGVKCPELKHVSWDEYDIEFATPLLTLSIGHFILVMYSLGIKEREKIIENWDIFVHKTRWYEFWKRVIEIKESDKMEEWWDKVKEEFKRLEYVERDELKMGNVKVGDIVYFPLKAKNKKELFETVQRAGYGFLYDGAKSLVGESLADSLTEEVISLAHEFILEKRFSIHV
ncbi:MAG TPA: hypothetical protein EYH58_07000 [Aquifex aeolicus]|nr:hypothetical protein [Aquifex aeolicus]